MNQDYPESRFHLACWTGKIKCWSWERWPQSAIQARFHRWKVFFFGQRSAHLTSGKVRPSFGMMAITKLYFCLHWFHDAVSDKTFLSTKMLTYKYFNHAVTWNMRFNVRMGPHCVIWFFIIIIHVVFECVLCHPVGNRKLQPLWAFTENRNENF